LRRVKTALLRLLGRLGMLGLAFRAFERVQALRAGPDPRPDDDLPLPPARLRVSVAWTADAEWFLEGGRLAAESIRAALGRHGVEPERLGSLLDFGCGCGRVTRRWASLDGVTVAGSDMNVDAVEWCRRNLPFARFETNALEPPLAFADETFDFVHALSVFTHLPEDAQRDWMRELRRVLRPDGLLLLTTHGRAYLDRLDDGERARFERGEIVVRRADVPGTNLCSAYHSLEALHRLAEGFAVLEHVEEGAKGNPPQDQALLRKT
jgi:SAM-dependent methyltransferase